MRRIILLMLVLMSTRSVGAEVGPTDPMRFLGSTNLSCSGPVCLIEVYTSGDAVSVGGQTYPCMAYVDIGVATVTKRMPIVWLLVPKAPNNDPTHKYRFAQKPGAEAIEILDNDDDVTVRPRKHHKDFDGRGRVLASDRFYSWKVSGPKSDKPSHAYQVYVERTLTTDVGWTSPETCGPVDPTIANNS